MKKLKEARSWFKWDYRAREDEKLMKLIRYEGYEGYGLFIAIIEFLHESNGKCMFDDLSYAIRCQDNTKLKRVLEDYDVFYLHQDIDGAYYMNKRVDEQLIDRKEASVRGRTNVNKRYGK